MKPTVRFRVDFTAGCSLGPGKVQLLEEIERTGSLRQAARALGMSYRRAWLLLDQLNRSFTTPATTSVVGGAGGGGATLTDFGRRLVSDYRALERAVQSLTRQRLEPIAASARPRNLVGTRRRLTRTSPKRRTD